MGVQVWGRSLLRHDCMRTRLLPSMPIPPPCASPSCCTRGALSPHLSMNTGIRGIQAAVWCARCGSLWGSFPTSWPVSEPRHRHSYSLHTSSGTRVLWFTRLSQCSSTCRSRIRSCTHLFAPDTPVVAHTCLSGPVYLLPSVIISLRGFSWTGGGVWAGGSLNALSRCLTL